MKKLRFLPLLTLLAALLLLPGLSRGEEMRGYDSDAAKGTKWQFLQMGEYPYEKDGTVKPVLWRILSVDDDRILVVTEYVIDKKQIIFETDEKVIKAHSFRRISKYSESDLFPWLNTEEMDALFGNDPLRGAILLEDPEIGMLHPLTFEQATNKDYGFSPGIWGEALNQYPDRQTVCTPYAKANGMYVDAGNGKSPWWTIRIKAPDDYKFGLVGYNGHISWGAYTNAKVAGLRLSVTLDRNKVRVTGGSGAKDDPFTLEYLPGEEVPAPAEPAPDAEAPAETVPEEAAPAEPVPETGGTPEAEVPAENAEPAEAEPAETETAEAKTPETAAAPDPDSVLISFVGDCSIGDGYRQIAGANSYHSVIDREGYAWPFSLVRDWLASDDMTVANLEVVLTEQKKHKDIVYPLRGAPDHVNVLLEGSIETVCTVNNHCYDFMRAGYMDTLAVLDSAGIARFGSVYYKKKDGFDDLLVKEIKGIRFGFVGISLPQNSDKAPLLDRIKKLKEEEGCDIVVVSLHWGRETILYQEKYQVNFAKQLIDGGADVIYGHHPHVLQPLMFYKGKPVMFSTGNFTFGTMSKVDPHTGIFRFTYRKNGDGVQLASIQVVPCSTSGGGDYRPYELTDEAERKKTWRILTTRKSVPKDFVNPPDYFLETGWILFNEDGSIRPEQ